MRVEVHPVFSIQIFLDQLHNVELSNRGYYQIRISAKPNPDLTLEFRAERSDVPAGSPTSLLPSMVQNGVAISRTIELVFADESLHIDDVFNLSVRAAARVNCVCTYRLELNVELWYADRDRPPRNDNFSFLSKRTLEIDLHTDCAQNAYRPVMFEFFAFSAVTIGVYSSLVSMLPRRRKNPPDPLLSQKLRDYHQSMCRAMLRSIRSLEVFITNNAKLVNTSLYMELTDIASEEESFATSLECSPAPWNCLESDAVKLSSRLATIHSQFLQLFSKSIALMTRLAKDFDDWRWRQLGEAFFFTEKPIQDLVKDSSNTFSHLFALINTTKYLHKLGRNQLFCPQIDSPPDTIPVIFEERFLPSSSEREAPVVAITARPDVNKSVRDCSDVETSRSQHKTTREKLASFRFRRKSNDSSKKKFLLRRNTLTNGNGIEKALSEPPTVTHSTEASHGGTPISEIGLIATPASDGSGDSASVATCAFPFIEGAPESIRRVVEFVQEREHLKIKLLLEKGYDGCLYSQLNSSLRPPCLADSRSSSDRTTILAQPPHLIVFVHGLEGGADDLIPYRNFLRIILPGSSMLFLMSKSNLYDTWTDLETMGDNLLDEVADYVANMARPPVKISFIAHSLGGIIVRSAVGKSDAKWLREKTHTLLTLNAPHLGLAYGLRAANWGVALVQWWKKSRSIEQLSLRDAVNFSESFLFNLSKNKAFGQFKYVLVVGAPGDVYVPLHSALLEPCKASLKDPSALGMVYREMLLNIKDDIMTSEKETTLIKYTAFHNMSQVGRTHRLTGRAAHTAVVDDDLFIEKLLSVSALKYFK